jgi:hypothetical protein
MMKRHLMLTLASAGLVMGASVFVFPPQVPHGVVLFDAGRTTWTPGGGPGSVRASIYGDPSKPGPYLHIIKVPPHAMNSAHSYSDDRRYTVISGTWYVGFGKTHNESQLIALSAGSYYALPAGVAVFNKTKDDGAIIQIQGTGPTQHIDLKDKDHSASSQND